ncbi:hypothetical protein WA158_008307 [Blastocystis sp. Blastoise]
MDKVIEQFKIPVSNEESFPNVKRGINCMSLDPSGARMATGTVDGYLRLYDFNGMYRDHKPFRESILVQNQSVVSIDYNKTGELFFCATSDSKPAFYDRELRKVSQCVKGDPYLFDASKTCGHQNNVRDVKFNPVELEKAVSCSVDCSVRFWDVYGPKNFDEIKSINIIRTKNKRGLKTPASTCCFTDDGKSLAIGTLDGSIQIFDQRATYSRPNRVVFDAHMGDITSLQYSIGNRLLVSRGKDDCVRVWDSRKLTKPLHIYTNIYTIHDVANTSFGPSQGIFVTGTIIPPKSQEKAKLLFFDVNNNTNEPIYTKEISETNSIIGVRWSSPLNQIFVGMTDGSMMGYYDPQYSKKGLILSSTKTTTKKEEMHFGREDAAAWAVDGVYQPKGKTLNQKRLQLIHPTPDVLPGPSLPEGLTKMPATPLSVLADKEYNQFGADYVRDVTEDPREALIKQALKPADKDTEYINYVFRKNDPHPQLAKRTLEEDLDEEEKRIKKRHGSL